MSSNSTRRAWPWIEDFGRDVRFGLRALLRSPAFTGVAVLTLAVGIGANAAVVSLLDAVLLRPLPVPSPDRLVVVHRVNRRGEPFSFSYPLYDRVRGIDAFSGVTAVLDDQSLGAVSDQAGQRSQPVSLHFVSANYFEVLGTSPLFGRTFISTGMQSVAPQPMAVLSHGFWKRYFHSDPGVVGREIQIRGQGPQARNVQVIGVAAPGFFGEVAGRAPDLWLPLTMYADVEGQPSWLANPNVGWLAVMGRLRNDVHRQQADSALSSLGPLHTSDGSQGLSSIRERFAVPLRIMAGLVTVLLVIACANVSSLLLARGTARRREIGVRLAIGASRSRLIRQCLAESALLVTISGIASVFVASWGTLALLGMGSDNSSPLQVSVAPDLRTFSLGAALLLAIVMLVGLVPAISTTRLDMAGVLRLGVTTDRRSRLASVLVVCQIAMSVVLLLASALFVRSLQNLRDRDPGFEPHGLLTAVIARDGDLRPSELAERRANLVRSLPAVPGVESVAFASTSFGRGVSRTCCLAVQGYPHEPGEDREMRMIGVSPGYFHTARLPLLSGRDFVDGDVKEDPNQLRAAIVSRTFQDRYFGGRSPVGQRIGWGDPPNVSYGIEIVGVAEDAIYDDLHAAVRPLMYVPQAGGDLLVRTDGSHATTTRLRDAIVALEKTDRIQVIAISDEIERSIVRDTLLAKLSSFFGVVATGLAALGLYGLLVRMVERRTREIGIRMALGAPRGQLLWTEIGSAFALTSLGLAIGLPLAVATAGSSKSLLFGVSASDVSVLTIPIGVLLSVSLLAAVIPARRAASVDPIQTLRHE